MVSVTADAATSEQKLHMPLSDHDVTLLMEDITRFDQ